MTSKTLVEGESVPEMSDLATEERHREINPTVRTFFLDSLICIESAFKYTNR